MKVLLFCLAALLAPFAASAEDRMPSLGGATQWINSPPLDASSLQGKVVLVDFWTYTCINWLRTLPYVRAWAEKYKDRGLVVIGVHTPEFSFEGNIDNVRRAVKAMDIDYPVAVDSRHAVWRAFDNHYWPALYLVDAKGRIRHYQFGEGDYDRAELVIQQLLAEGGGTASAEPDLVSVDGHATEAPADWDSLKSPETYLGSDKSERRARAGPQKLALNQWSLAGDWSVGREAVALKKANGRIAYRFHARDVHLILSPAAAGAPVRFRVSIDGRAPGGAHGVDVDEQGNGTVTQPRLYQLIRQPQPITDRQFEIEFLDPGVQAYAFTFG